MVNILLKIILSKFFLFSSLTGKDGSLSGAVRGYDGALPGANVFLVGTSMGTVTDSLGNYKIDNIPLGKYVLRADYMGYQPDETEIYISVLQENNAGSEDFSSSFAAKLGLEDDEFIVAVPAFEKSLFINNLPEESMFIVPPETILTFAADALASMVTELPLRMVTSSLDVGKVLLAQFDELLHKLSPPLFVQRLTVLSNLVSII